MLNIFAKKTKHISFTGVRRANMRSIGDSCNTVQTADGLAVLKPSKNHIVIMAIDRKS